MSVAHVSTFSKFRTQMLKKTKNSGFSKEIEMIVFTKRLQNIVKLSC